MQVVPIPLQTIQKIKGMNAEGCSHCRERREENASARHRGQAFLETELQLVEVGHQHLSKVPLWLLQNYAKNVDINGRHSPNHRRRTSPWPLDHASMIAVVAIPSSVQACQTGSLEFLKSWTASLYLYLAGGA